MNTVAEALADVDRAFLHLEFAIRMMCHCELGPLDLKSSDSDLSILLERESVGFPSGTFATTEATMLAAQALVGVAFGVSATVLDAAFDVAGRKNRPDSRVGGHELRTLVRMVRCAFAHNPALPVWEARGPYARQLALSVEGASLSVDLVALHGQAFEYKHIGGFGNWLRIRDASRFVLNTAQQGAAADAASRRGSALPVGPRRKSNADA